MFWAWHTTEKCVVNHPAKFESLKKNRQIYEIRLQKSASEIPLSAASSAANLATNLATNSANLNPLFAGSENQEKWGWKIV